MDRVNASCELVPGAAADATRLGRAVVFGLGSVSQQSLVGFWLEPVMFFPGQQNFPKPRSSQPKSDVHGSDLNWSKYGCSQQLPPQQLMSLGHCSFVSHWV